MIADDGTPAVMERTADFGSLYEQNVGLLIGTAVQQFHISETDAEALAHEAFLAYFLKADEVRNPRAWLLSAIFNASKHYLRARARYVALLPRSWSKQIRGSRASLAHCRIRSRPMRRSAVSPRAANSR